MIEITDDLEQKIRNLLNSGMRNKLQIFNTIIEDDDEIKEILNLYKHGKIEEDITIETKIPIETVRKAIKVSTEIYSIINRSINIIYSKSHYKSLVIKRNMPHSTEKELEESIRLIRKEKFKNSVERAKEKVYGTKCEMDDMEL